ncbi:hypothetical protein BGX38DRAFT_1178413 [Terfezia claveryi]|nr:hypothetical protein BGX38DRAFT_1178413 [Terfezia claveryi]
MVQQHNTTIHSTTTNPPRHKYKHNHSTDTGSNNTSQIPPSTTTKHQTPESIPSHQHGVAAVGKSRAGILAVHNEVAPYRPYHRRLCHLDSQPQSQLAVQGLLSELPRPIRSHRPGRQPVGPDLTLPPSSSSAAKGTYLWQDVARPALLQLLRLVAADQSASFLPHDVEQCSRHNRVLVVRVIASAIHIVDQEGGAGRPGHEPAREICKRKEITAYATYVSRSWKI